MGASWAPRDQYEMLTIEVAYVAENCGLFGDHQRSHLRKQKILLFCLFTSFHIVNTSFDFLTVSINIISFIPSSFKHI